jgi:uncharacterized protein (AIM24 family)
MKKAGTVKNKPRRKQKGGDTNVDFQVKQDGGGFDELCFDLRAGQSVLVEAGALSYMDAAVNAKVEKNSIAGYMFSGESLFRNRLTAPSEGGPYKVCVAPVLPGSIVALQLFAGDEYVISRGAFLAGTVGVSVTANFRPAGILVGEGVALTLVSLEAGVQNGSVWISGFGVAHKQVLNSPADSLWVDNGMFLAMKQTPGAVFNISMTGGLATTLFGGEGLAMTFTGPCEVYTQSRNINNFKQLLRMDDSTGAGFGATVEKSQGWFSWLFGSG